MSALCKGVFIDDFSSHFVNFSREVQKADRLSRRTRPFGCRRQIYAQTNSRSHFLGCQAEFDFGAGKDTLVRLNPVMNTLNLIIQNPTPPQGASWASSQALAILAVDGIRPSNEGVALMQSIDAGTMTHAQAIQSIIERARLYANH